MAKKATKKAAAPKAAKKKSAGDAGKVRDRTVPAGKVADFSQVREGTDRGNLINFIRGGSKSIADCAKELGTDAKTVSLILYFLNRHKGIGYTIANETVSLQFPGSNTWQDAIKKSSEEKKAA